MAGYTVIMSEIHVANNTIPRRGAESFRDQTHVIIILSPYDQMDKRRQTTRTWERFGFTYFNERILK